MQFPIPFLRVAIINIFSDKDYKPKAPSPASSMLWLAGDVKEPTRLSQRVGHEVPGAVVVKVRVGVGKVRRY